MPPRRYSHLALVPLGTQPNPDCRIYTGVDDADTRAHLAAVEVADRMLTWAGAAAGQRVLVVGAGRGLILRALAERATALEVAVVEQTLEHAAELRAAGAAFDTCSIRLGVDLRELDPDGEPPYDAVLLGPAQAQAGLVLHAQRFLRPSTNARVVAVLTATLLARVGPPGDDEDELDAAVRRAVQGQRGRLLELDGDLVLVELAGRWRP